MEMWPELCPEQIARMARTHGLDKRLAEEQHAMSSTQKLPKHHSYASSTQDPAGGASGSAKASGGRYDSGTNVHSKGGGGRAPKPKTPPVAQGPASKSKQGSY